MGVESGAIVDRTEPPERASRAPRMHTFAPAIVGLALVIDGLRRRSLTGGVEILLGGLLLSRTVGPKSELPETGTVRRPAVDRGSITIGRDAEELSTFVRQPSNLHEALSPAVEVTSIGPDRLRFSLDPPVGPSVDWEMELVEERPGELVRWSGGRGTSLVREMAMRFRPAPGDRGTELSLEITLDPPGGRFGAAALQRLGVVPNSLVRVTLDRLKSLAETGEVPTTAGNPSGRGRGDVV